jgi:hypothetical protein
MFLPFGCFTSRWLLTLFNPFVARSLPVGMGVISLVGSIAFLVYSHGLAATLDELARKAHSSATSSAVASGRGLTLQQRLRFSGAAIGSCFLLQAVLWIASVCLLLTSDQEGTGAADAERGFTVASFGVELVSLLSMLWIFRPAIRRHTESASKGLRRESSRRGRATPSTAIATARALTPTSVSRPALPWSLRVLPRWSPRSGPASLEATLGACGRPPTRSCCPCRLGPLSAGRVSLRGPKTSWPFRSVLRHSPQVRTTIPPSSRSSDHTSANIECLELCVAFTPTGPRSSRLICVCLVWGRARRADYRHSETGRHTHTHTAITYHLTTSHITLNTKLSWCMHRLLSSLSLGPLVARVPSIEPRSVDGPEKAVCRGRPAPRRLFLPKPALLAVRLHAAPLLDRIDQPGALLGSLDPQLDRHPCGTCRARPP